MAIYSNNAEGQASGTTVTTANSGGGGNTAFNAVNRNNTALMYTSAQAMHGQQCFYFGLESAITSVLVWNGFSTTQVSTRFYFKMAKLPSTAHRLWEINDATSFAATRLMIAATNRFLLQLSDGTVTAKLFTTTLSVNTWYRVEIISTNGTSNGTVRMDYYLGDSMTPVETGYSSTTVNTGTTSALTNVAFGSGANSSTMGDSLWMDDLYLETDVLAYQGPSGSGQTSTVWFTA